VGAIAKKDIIVTPDVGVLPSRRLYRFLKRMFDIVFSFLAIVVLTLPMLVIAIIVKFDGGPVIFKQKRLGLKGKAFTIYKFRTMVPDAEANGVQWAAKDDPRITKFGRFLRKTQVDEWPQFFNIFGGSMSFVGPRPEVQKLHDAFCQYVKGFEQRLLVKPGLTGWAQVNGGAALLPEQKIVFDIEYMRRQSLWFDFRCLIRTVGVIFNPKGY